MRKLLLLNLLFIIGYPILAQADKNTTIDKLYPQKEVVSRYHNDWTQRHYRDRIQVFENAPLEFNEVVFIGNSITEKGRNWSEKFGVEHIRNRGIAGDVTEGVLKRLGEITYYKPQSVFILIGINDLCNIHYNQDTRGLKYDKIVPSPEYVARNIIKIAKTIHRQSPNTVIYVRTILPTRREYLKDDILVVNQLIRQNEKLGYYKVIDLYKQFVDEDGYMQKELTVDGIHLSELGYEKWVNYEQAIIQGISSNDL